MSKRTRRNAGNKNYKEADSDDESEFTLQNIALDIFRRIASRSARSPRVRTATRRKRSTTTSRSSRGRCSANASTSTSRRSRSRNLRNPSTVSIDTSQSDDGEYDERVRDRVNSHFKSTILVSDDEDIVIPPVEKPARLPDRFSKDLYVLSDSDDDVLPSTSFDRNPTSCSHTVQDTIATDIPGGPTKQDTAPTEDLTGNDQV
ncbi:unnamed protein product [Callosobruchus maculatus]|uniref:Uncharacterized protein n=1 Tax=Callosobruchus maculatus TaxID=64391 RepID=A0A653BDR3_CALMS|nr:unnamed protein product [Callosobruchus maculatus]